MIAPAGVEKAVVKAVDQYAKSKDPLANRLAVAAEAANQAKSERDAGFFGKNGMTGDEDESQEVIANFVVELFYSKLDPRIKSEE